MLETSYYEDPDLAIMRYPNTLNEVREDYLEFVNKRGNICKNAPLLDPAQVAGYEICEKSVRDKSGPDRIDPAFAAVRQVASAAIALTNREFSTDDPSPEIGIPVVVTSGFLYEAWMDQNEQIQVEKVARSKVVVKIDGSHDSIVVHVVSESGIQDFASDCDDTAAILVGHSEGYGLD